MRRWLHRKLKHNQHISANRNRPFDIDIDFVMELYEQQNGKCAISGLTMTHRIDDLCAASIDRIKSGNSGYTRDNVQLICTWVNTAKRHFADEEMRSVLYQYKELIVKKTITTLAKMISLDEALPIEIAVALSETAQTIGPE